MTPGSAVSFASVTRHVTDCATRPGSRICFRKRSLFYDEKETTCVVVDSLLIVAPILGFCSCSMFCCALLFDRFSFAIILMGRREHVALLRLSDALRS